MSTPDGNPGNPGNPGDPERKNGPGQAGHPGGAEPDSVDSVDRKVELSYEGARVPSYVVIIWILFFLWGVVYFLRFIPTSIREWFTRG